MPDRSFPYGPLAGFYFFYFAFVGAFAPYWSLYLRSLGYVAAEIGLLMALPQVMRMLAPAAWGWLADATGRRVEILRLAALAALLSYAGVFFGAGFAWMWLVMAAMSFFWSASLPLVEAITLSHLGPHAARYGRIRWWGSLGFILAVVGIGHLLDGAPIFWLLWILLALKLAVAASAARVPDAPVRRAPEEAVPLWRIVRRPEVGALLAACFLMAAAHGPYYVFFSIYLVDVGYTKGQVGWLWALGVICEIGVFFLMPRVAARYSGRAILLVSFGCAVLRFALVAAFPTAPLLMLFAQSLHAATFGAYHAAAVAAFHRLFQGSHPAKGQALYTSVSFGAGGSLGSLLSGYLWEAAGPGFTFMASAAAAALGGLVIAWRFPAER